MKKKVLDVGSGFLHMWYFTAQIRSYCGLYHDGKLLLIFLLLIQYLIIYKERGWQFLFIANGFTIFSTRASRSRSLKVVVLFCFVLVFCCCDFLQKWQKSPVPVKY